MAENNLDAFAGDFEIFLSHTNEKQILIDELKACVEESSVESILDIGAGDGSLGFPLAGMVSKYVALEQNPAYARQFADAGLNVKDGIFPDVTDDDQYDLVLMSHVIPYKNENYKYLVPAAWERVKADGQLVVVTRAENTDDWGVLLDEIGLSELPANRRIYSSVVEMLSSLGEVTAKNVRTELNTADIHSMIGALTFLAANGRDEERRSFIQCSSDVSAILEQRYTSRNGYTFPIDHALIRVQK